eukprot:m.169987 g.169987  ORF g.169987 m.169987 type:complete len:511 (+) comp16678_c0_seq1:29-1561(+)
MVLLSAAICTKTGKPLVARQFMEISRSRIEGLLAAFPKLRGAEDQHTFIETDSVRYVYQPMEQLYMVLITTKNSNILEDLETLRLFAKVVPEFCQVMTESEVAANAFELIFAFDEVIALGYREQVNLSQIRTYTEMESHDENIYKMVQKNKEREAKEHMKRKAKELTMLKKEKDRFGGSSGYSGASSSMGSSSMGQSAPSYTPAVTASKPAAASSKPRKSRGMKLGGKAKTSDFVDALIAEGESVAEDSSTLAAPVRQSVQASAPDVATDDIHVKVDEKITLEANRDGGLEHMEVKGTMFVSVSNEAKAMIQLHTTRDAGKNASFQTHPNMDKKAFNNDGVIKLKNASRPFPIDSEVGVVKWRYQTTDESAIPLTVNCWPNENSDGSVDVNIDYELQDKSLKLEDVVMMIPLPAGSNPVVASADGDYDIDSRHHMLRWSIPFMEDGNGDEGSLEFSMSGGTADDFFPVTVEFRSEATFVGLEVEEVTTLEGDAFTFSKDIAFTTDSYDIV